MKYLVVKTCLGTHADCCYETHNVDEALKILNIVDKNIDVHEKQTHVRAAINVVPETFNEFESLKHEKELRRTIVVNPYDFKLKAYRKPNKDEIAKNKEILKKCVYTRKIKDDFLIY